jgi:uncharacterized protein YcbK (DUF882 family)
MLHTPLRRAQPSIQSSDKDVDITAARESCPGLSRRGVLKLGALALGAALMPRLALGYQGTSATAERSLSLYNDHTGEPLNTVYWVEGEYVPEALAEINHLLRDHRTDQMATMDLELLDLLYALGRKIDARRPFHVISGYRSPKTNARLRQRSRKVAKRSQHMYGKAVDLYVPGCKLADLRRAALSLRRGGVGYYPQSHFIHVDTARVRFW